MISIEEACKIALTKIPENKKIIEVLETDLFWVFVDETFEKPVIGPSPLAIFKNDGHIEPCSPVHMKFEIYNSMSKKKKIPFPEYLVTSGRAKTPAPSGN